ncbi:MAG: ATP-binding protein [Thermoanaerobaculia bacterium]
MDLREEFDRRRKDTRFVAAVLALLLGLLTIIYYLVQRGRDLPATLVTNRVLLFFLRNVNLLLIVVILFVLARNLYKLWVDRRQRVLGARFKTKLVATYVGLSLVPVLLLFFYASEMLQGAVDRWFSESLRSVLRQGSDVAQVLQQTITERNFREARRVLREVQRLDLGAAAERARLSRRLADFRADAGADYLAVFDDQDFVQAVVDSQSGITDLPEIGRSALREALDRGRADRVLLPPGTRGRLILAVAAAPAPDPSGRRAIVAVGSLLDPRLAASSEELIQSYQSYRQLEVQKGEFKASYLLTFLLVTLLILLASSWMGLYLARRVMTPIQALAEGTRRISSGNLDERIEVAADDEMAGVVESFNRMTEELARNRELVERSTRELRAANQRIAEERGLVGAILENLAAGVVSLDPGGRILTANAAALQMLRQEESALVGRTPAEAWGDAEHAPLAAFLEREAGGGRRAASEVQLVLAGERKTFEAKVTRLRAASGEAAGRVVVLEELTELVKAQKLAAWTEAARRIAHEIKNPLTPIRLAAERLLRRHRQGDAQLGPLLEESVEIIGREVATMQAMVDEFSRYAKMPGPQLAPTALRPLVAEVVALYRDVKPGVELRNLVGENLGEIWLDPEQMRRVLINLIDNALEAVEPPGTVEVSAARRDDRVEIAVADSGRGVPPELREKLFLPFFSTKKRGTGMGLAIVHRMVSDHHGTLRVEANEPHGSVFRIEIPAR